MNTATRDLAIIDYLSTFFQRYIVLCLSPPGASPNAALAKSTNMVYVSFNYRLNALGFVSLEVLSKFPNRTRVQQGNYGLSDQIMVLRWVQKNIKQFGGDPTKVFSVYINLS